MIQNSPIFLSYFLSENTPVYGGEKSSIIFEKVRSIEKGDNSNNLKLIFPVHIGTHIDFPFHFHLSGKKCEDYPASFWVFKNIGFLDCSIEEIEKKLVDLSPEIEMLILKTGFGTNRSNDLYWSSQPVIPAKLADIFKNKFPKLRVFGFDMISLTSKLDRLEGKLAHINFLINNDILVLEDMKLDELTESPSLVIVAPLQINNADGAPCSIIAYP